MTQVTEFSSMLNFASLRSEHRGNYTCRANNMAGSSNHTAPMIIQGKSIKFNNYFLDPFLNFVEIIQSKLQFE